ncbi:hypothetical protein J4468_00520 [Candidatus Woesearchaeota archaeon]|nr:hypothetical protein [Candidatus Woesearchaeota archaeon]
MKKGAIHWDYLAYMLLALLTLVVLFLLTASFKDKMLEGITSFWKLLGIR